MALLPTASLINVFVAPSPYVLRVSLFHYTTQNWCFKVIQHEMKLATDWADYSGACFQATNSVFVEFMINDIFFDLTVHFLAYHQSHLSLRPLSSHAFTNVQLLEKFKSTFQFLSIVVKTMKTPVTTVCLNQDEGCEDADKAYFIQTLL